MPREVHRLSAKAIEKMRVQGYHSDGGGLYLQVSPTLSKSWIFRYTRDGRSREMGLGSERDVSLAVARTKAAEARRQLADGLDPIEVRREGRAQERLKRASTTTMRDGWTKYIAAHRAGWRNEKHAEQWTNTLETYAGPEIGGLAMRDVDTGHILRVLEPIWSKKPETATRVRGRLERVLDYGKVRGWRAGENPARWRGHLDKILPAALNRKTRKHHPALPYDELPAFLVELRAQEGTAARALEWLILNASRTNEVIGCEPHMELDLKKGVWTVPAERMKGGRIHRVPLSPRALELAKAQPAGTYLFTGMRDDEPLSNMAMLEVLRRMGRTGLTVHGFRSTFKDWASECTTYPNEVSEMALAHAIVDKSEAAYRRGDLFEKRRQLMADWARFCEAPKSAVRISHKRAPA